MIYTKIKKIFFSVLSLSLFSFSLQAQAQLIDPTGKGEITGDMEKAGKAATYDTAGGVNNFLLSDLAYNVASAFLGLLGMIFLIMIIIGGFNWMTAAGSEDKVSKAKATLFRGIIGLFIIVAAYVITIFVFKAFGGIVGRA